MTDRKLNLTMLCDYYELTMGNGYFDHGMGDKITYFDVFYRQNPDNGGFAIAAGLEQVVEYIQNLHFDDEDIEYLRGRKMFSEQFLEYLRNFKFEGDIWAVPEGTPVFPREPLMIVRAPAIQAQLIETYVLLEINHQSLIATKANRVCRAAEGRVVLEFGSRRAQGIDGAVTGARAAYIGGCAGTACALSDTRYGVPAGGTMAHSWVQMFDSEYEAFKAYCETYPTNATLLVDTYNIEEAVKTAVEVAGPNLGGVRIDRYAFLNVVQLQDLADLLEGEIYIDVEDDVSDLNVYRGYQDVRPVLAGFASYSYLNDIGGIDYPGTDPYKLRRHQQLIEAFLSDFSGQMEALSQQEQEALAQDIVDCLRTDLTAQDVQSWTGQVRRLHTAQILEGYENETDQDSYWIPERSALKTWVIEHFYCGQDEEE